MNAAIWDLLEVAQKAGAVRPDVGVERIYHCDAPECEGHVRTSSQKPAGGLITTTVKDPGGQATFHFCNWDCVLRFAATQEPAERGELLGQWTPRRLGAVVDRRRRGHVRLHARDRVLRRLLRRVDLRRADDFVVPAAQVPEVPATLRSQHLEVHRDHLRHWDSLGCPRWDETTAPKLAHGVPEASDGPPRAEAAGPAPRPGRLIPNERGVAPLAVSPVTGAMLAWTPDGARQLPAGAGVGDARGG